MTFGGKLDNWRNSLISKILSNFRFSQNPKFLGILCHWDSIEGMHFTCRSTTQKILIWSNRLNVKQLRQTGVTVYYVYFQCMA